MKKKAYTEITKSFYVRCAHKLTGLNEDHKCMNIHGEYYKIILTFRCPIQPTALNANMLIDFAVIKDIFQKMIGDEIDHALLISKNDKHFEKIDALGLKTVVLDYSPTVEYLAYWIYNSLKQIMPLLYKVTVVESKDNDASYYEES